MKVPPVGCLRQRRKILNNCTLLACISSADGSGALATRMTASLSKLTVCDPQAHEQKWAKGVLDRLL
jgi:hypothetical protein